MLWPDYACIRAFSGWVFRLCVSGYTIVMYCAEWRYCVATGTAKGRAIYFCDEHWCLQSMIQSKGVKDRRAKWQVLWWEPLLKNAGRKEYKILLLRPRFCNVLHTCRSLHIYGAPLTQGSICLCGCICWIGASVSDSCKIVIIWKEQTGRWLCICHASWSKV